MNRKQIAARSLLASALATIIPINHFKLYKMENTQPIINPKHSLLIH